MESSAARERMLAGLSVRRRRLAVNGLDTSIWEVGAGSPLLLLHGASSAVEPCGRAAGRLAERHRVVVPNIPGLGESAPTMRLDADAYAGWLSGLLRKADPGSPTVVAHSLVGSLTGYATLGPDRIADLIIYAAPGVGPYRTSWRLRYVALRFAIRPTRSNAERFDRFALHDYGATRARDSDWYEAFETYNRRQASVPHVKQLMSRLIAGQAQQIPDSELRRIRPPVTLLWGRHDRMVPLSVAEYASRRHGGPCWSSTMLDTRPTSRTRTLSSTLLAGRLIERGYRRREPSKVPIRRRTLATGHAAVRAAPYDVGATAARVEWDAFDVLAPSGARIEVKASAYLQAWDPRQPSRIVFGGVTGRTWSSQAGRQPTATYNADVYAFCMQIASRHEQYDPLDLNQLQFYVLPGSRVAGLGYKSIGLTNLAAAAGPAIEYAQLAEALDTAYARELEGQRSAGVEA